MYRPKHLNVWLYGTLIGRLVEPTRSTMRLEWTSVAAKKFGLGSTILSSNLPVSATNSKPLATEAFFEGILAEGERRNAFAYDAELDRSDLYGLLSVYGKESAGAIIIDARDDADHSRQSSLAYAPVTERRIADVFRSQDPAPQLLENVPVDASIAGMQNKVLLSRKGTQWMVPIDGSPSMFIVKGPSPRPSMTAQLHVEQWCMDIAKALEVGSVETSIISFDGLECIVIPRYDRVLEEDQIQRIHQEDLCQATGRKSVLKYSAPDRPKGPTHTEAAKILQSSTVSDSNLEQRRLLRWMALHVMLGSSEGHGKNLSFLHHEDGAIELAPMYDIATTLHIPEIRSNSGMPVGGETHLHQIQYYHLANEAMSWGMNENHARSELQNIGEQLRDIVRNRDIPEGVPEDAVQVVLSQTQRILDGSSGTALTPITLSLNSTGSSHMCEYPLSGGGTCQRPVSSAGRCWQHRS